MTKKPTTNSDSLRKRAAELRLFGLLSFFDEIADEPWVERLLDAEEQERQRRSLERRQANARIGLFRPMVDFDWAWPTHIDRDSVEDLFHLHFLEESANVIIRGANGLGKTMIAQNLAHQAVLAGHTARFVSASEMLNDLAAKDSTASLHRRLQRYYRPGLLAVDELGYLAYDDRHADLLFEVVSRRYGKKSTLITTNKAFSEWSEVFPNSSCVVALVDRLIHRAEVIRIEGESYRLKEAKEREDKRTKTRLRKRSRK
jgi:DNA replication protein DnaC